MKIFESNKLYLKYNRISIVDLFSIHNAIFKTAILLKFPALNIPSTLILRKFTLKKF